MYSTAAGAVAVDVQLPRRAAKRMLGGIMEVCML